LPGKETGLRWGDEWTFSSSALGVVILYSMTMFESELQPEGCGLSTEDCSQDHVPPGPQSKSSPDKVIWMRLSPLDEKTAVSYRHFK